jgi:hypothetical protein
MVRLRKTPRNQALAETRQRQLDAAAVESANEGSEGEDIDQISPTAGYVKWEGMFNYFSGVQAVLSALIEAWQRRRAKPS